MNGSPAPPTGKPKSPARRLLESGIIFSAISFITGLVNFSFLGLIGRRFLNHEGELGLTTNTNTFIAFLSLPLLIATTAVTHYIAHFHATDDQPRLRGLLLGCRKVLFWFTIGGSVLALLLVVPLSRFFHFSRYSLVVVALGCVLAMLWGYFATALCQGLAWFKRLAVIGLVGALMRWGFTWYVTLKHPLAEYAVAATGVALLSNVALLYWRKELFRHGNAVSPWDREFVQYLIASAACVGGSYLFLNGDQLVAQRYFVPADRDAYSIAIKLATALNMVAGPLLIVLFTSRSAERSGSALSAQLKLLALYAGALLVGAAGLMLMRDFCVRIVRGGESPEAAAMIAPLALTMVFGGLLQALGMWALASRWLKLAGLYGVLGLGYWITLLSFGTTPQNLLRLMPVISGAAVGVVLVFWIGAMKQAAASGDGT